MELEPHTILTLLGVVAGIGGTWATLNHRIKAVEGQGRAVEALRDSVASLNATLEFVRTDQGRRLGEVETTTKELSGQFRGFRDGFGVGRRSRTAAQGHKVGNDEDR